MKILTAQLTCKTDFLMSPPCSSLPFSARLLHLSFVGVCFVVSFQGAERMGTCLPILHPSSPLAAPWCAVISVLLCPDC